MYNLNLTPEDVETIAWVGRRYGWSTALLPLDEGDNELTEAEAWAIRDAIEEDTEGGHSPFPLLDPRSALAEKLTKFCERIV